MNRPPVLICLRLCLPRLREVSPSRVLFGDEPWPVLLALVVGVFVFYPLIRDDWPWLVVLMMFAALAHAWHWCREEAQACWSDTRDREAP